MCGGVCSLTFHLWAFRCTSLSEPAQRHTLYSTPDIHTCGRAARSDLHFIRSHNDLRHEDVVVAALFAALLTISTSTVPKLKGITVTLTTVYRSATAVTFPRSLNKSSPTRALDFRLPSSISLICLHPRRQPLDTLPKMKYALP